MLGLECAMKKLYTVIELHLPGNIVQRGKLNYEASVGEGSVIYPAWNSSQSEKKELSLESHPERASSTN